MTQPRITIITAALNPGAEVRQTIESVLAQRYQSLEYIFIDGGSQPSALELIEPYRKRFAVFVSERDEGISDAWNKGIALATGDIIGLINADDYLLPGALAAVADAYQQNGGASIVHGDALRVEGDRKRRRNPTQPLYVMIRFGTPVVHPATFVPRTIYDRIGAFDKSYKIAMDYDFILRAYRADVPFSRLARPLVGFRAGGLSDRKPLEGFREVRDSQLSHGFNRPLAQLIYTTKRFVRMYIRPIIGLA